MPNRIIREGILTSEAVNSLNWAEEVFYRRLLSVVDDFGRYYAAPKLLRAACYPLHIDKVSDSDIGKWLSACETAALVRVYPASDGKRYLEVQNFKQQQRAKESKFPHPPSPDYQLRSECVADAQQAQANAHLGVFGVEGVVGDEDGGGKAPRKRSAAPELACPADVDPQTWADWLALRRKKSAPVTVTVLNGARQEAEKAGMAFDAFLQVWCLRGSQGLQADWLKPDERNTLSRQTFAQQAADIARTTVPAKPGRDPTLVRLEQEALAATKPSAEIRERMAQLTRGAA